MSIVNDFTVKNCLCFYFQNDLDLSMEENSRLMDDLKRQQSLYNELKKMRGRGEEIDMLQNVEQVPYKRRIEVFLKILGL